MGSTKCENICWRIPSQHFCNPPLLMRSLPILWIFYGILYSLHIAGRMSLRGDYGIQQLLMYLKPSTCQLHHLNHLGKFVLSLFQLACPQPSVDDCCLIGGRFVNTYNELQFRVNRVVFFLNNFSSIWPDYYQFNICVYKSLKQSIHKRQQVTEYLEQANVSYLPQEPTVYCSVSQ